MRTLVIGGTSNLGVHVSNELITNGHEIFTLSRAKSGVEGFPHFECDIANQSRLADILEKMCKNHGIIDSIYCVAGYAVPTKIEDQNEDIMRAHLIRNVEYVELALSILHKNRAYGNDPFVVTFGSQWSYRSPSECLELTPYAKAKNTLMKCSSNFSSRYSLRVNHYCIPTSDTLTMRNVEDIFNKIHCKNLVMSHAQLANPETIANSLVDHSLGFNGSDKTFSINPQGSVSVIG